MVSHQIGPPQAAFTTSSRSCCRHIGWISNLWYNPLTHLEFLGLAAIMRRTIGRSLLAAFAVAASLTGCSAGPLTQELEHMPQSLGGLPADAPRAPASSYAYPAVHDMPPPRSSEPMSEEQQYRLEQELTRVRDRQEAAQGQKPGDDKAAKKTKKKKPPAASSQQNAGTTTNP